MSDVKVEAFIGIGADDPEETMAALADYLGPYVSGFTLSHGQGFWRDNDVTYSERSVIATWVGPNLSPDRLEFRSSVSAWATVRGEQSVLFVTTPVTVEFVELAQ